MPPPDTIPRRSIHAATIFVRVYSDGVRCPQSQTGVGAGEINVTRGVSMIGRRLSQWAKIKAYANAKGVKLLGDMPIYVGGHSADVWCNRELWTLDDKGLSAAVSGVPPDAFSDDGQLWGSPLYDWAAHEKVRAVPESREASGAAACSPCSSWWLPTVGPTGRMDTPASPELPRQGGWAWIESALAPPCVQR